MTLIPGALKVKDPDSVKVGSFNFDPYLPADVTIASHTVTISGPDDELVVDASSLATGNRAVNFQVSGGTLGRKYRITCHIVANGLPDDRSIRVLVQNL